MDSTTTNDGTRRYYKDWGAADGAAGAPFAAFGFDPAAAIALNAAAVPSG